MKRIKTFFVPGHITGFFQIFEHRDALRAGSRGCGIVIDKGVKTGSAVEEVGEEQNRIKIYLNKKPCSCNTSKTAAEKVLSGGTKLYSVEVHHETELPVSQGFGTSGAGAIGAALSLSNELKLGLAIEQVGRIAHASEVANKTGLGSVIAELSGGMVIRKKEGAPGIGEIEKIESESYAVAFITGREILTRNILKDEKKKRKINEAGRVCMKKILKEQTMENFLKLSKFFTQETMLCSKKSLELIKKLEKENITAAMSMLGNAVFTISEEPEKIIEKSGIDQNGGNVIIAKIRNEEVKV